MLAHEGVEVVSGLSGAVGLLRVDGSAVVREEGELERPECPRRASEEYPQDDQTTTPTTTAVNRVYSGIRQAELSYDRRLRPFRNPKILWGGGASMRTWTWPGMPTSFGHVRGG
jgi:hypothetical protein